MALEQLEKDWNGVRAGVWRGFGVVFIYRHLRLGNLGEKKCFGARYQNQSPGTCCFMKTNPGASGVGSAHGSPKSSPVPREL